MGEGWQGGLFIQLLFAYFEEYSNFIGSVGGIRTPNALSGRHINSVLQYHYATSECEGSSETRE